MHALRSAVLIALLLHLLGGVAMALDPRKVDILGLRLGMSRSEVIAHLVTQGIDRRLIRDEGDPCPGNPPAGCLHQLAAPTRDGTLVIRFVSAGPANGDVAWSIAYTLFGRLPGEPEIIRSAMLDHFGPPIGSSDPAIWCAHASGAACNPLNQPQVTFGQGRSSGGTLTIIDPSAVVRAPP